jgi:type IV pilus assembly protein PilE
MANTDCIVSGAAHALLPSGEGGRRPDEGDAAIAPSTLLTLTRSPQRRPPSPKGRGVTRPARGITLLELVMVAAIIGILASLAVPSFKRAIEQSRADVAATNLRAIWSAQRLYWLDNRTYAADLATLQSLDLVDGSLASQPFYQYEISAADSSGFTALAIRAGSSLWGGTLSIDGSGNVSGVLSADGEADIVPNY